MTLDAGGLGRSPRPLPTGLTDNYGLIWTAGILLRIRRLGVRVSPSAPSSAADCDLVTGPTRPLVQQQVRQPEFRS
jgi:hypothetical protein